MALRLSDLLSGLLNEKTLWNLLEEYFDAIVNKYSEINEYMNIFAI